MNKMRALQLGFGYPTFVFNILAEMLGDRMASLPAGHDLAETRVVLPTAMGDLRVRLAVEVRRTLAEQRAKTAPLGSAAVQVAPAAIVSARPLVVPAAAGGGAVASGGGAEAEAAVDGRGRAVEALHEAVAAAEMAEEAVEEMDEEALRLQLEPLHARIQAAASGLTGHICAMCRELVGTGVLTAMLPCGHIMPHLPRLRRRWHCGHRCG